MIQSLLYQQIKRNIFMVVSMTLFQFFSPRSRSNKKKRFLMEARNSGNDVILYPFQCFVHWHKLVQERNKMSFDFCFSAPTVKWTFSIILSEEMKENYGMGTYKMFHFVLQSIQNCCRMFLPLTALCGKSSAHTHTRCFSNTENWFSTIL